MASERAKNLGKRIIDYPEGEPTVLSSKDWVQNLVKDPKDYVSYLFLLASVIPAHIRDRPSTMSPDSSLFSAGLPGTVSVLPLCLASALINVCLW